MTSEEFLELVDELYEDQWPKPLHYVQGKRLVDRGQTIKQAARNVGTRRHFLEPYADEELDEADALESALEASVHDVDRDRRDWAIQRLGQLLLGRAAEEAFESVFREQIEEHGLEVRDLRRQRTDTDYRLFDESGQPVFRINVKFHGSLFRKAAEIVGLEPRDCFALATYKIHGALQKQEQEGLPYIFAVVGDRSLSARSVGERIPSRFRDAVAYYKEAPKAQGKRNFQDRVVEYMAENRVPIYGELFKAIRSEDWYILSARRADDLVREKLYERVFALRVRSFAQQFGGAEVDMHFSLSEDLTPLEEFFDGLEDAGLTRGVTLLERGRF